MINMNKTYILVHVPIYLDSSTVRVICPMFMTTSHNKELIDKL